MRIRRLSEGTVNRIAAGEVIERPASVVKELVENAIDAGAAQIDVAFRGGGKNLIRVSDDGIGMGPEDLALAVERHATSKLSEDDLVDIRFFGFRGEALPSIGSVSRLAITSRPRSGGTAHVIAVEGGLLSPPRPAALGQGTEIDVKDLFYATPARLKFLKADRTETAEAAEVVRRMALAHPEIGFSFVTEERRLVDVPKGEAEEARVRRILGPEFMENAIPFEMERESVLVRGYAGLPTWSRNTGAQQYMFVNGRSVRDKLLSGAIRGAYADVLPSGRFPALVLFLSCLPERVDVNVHPAKAEVRFRDGGQVRGLIVSAIRDGLGRKRTADTGLSRQTASSFKSVMPRPFVHRGFDEEEKQAALAMNMPPATAPVAEAAAVQPDYPLGQARTQIHDNYIVSQTRDGFILIDQHAAHERLVYERLKRERAERGIETQPLLVPEVVDLDPVQVERLAAAAELLAQGGLVLEAFGDGAVIIREVPAAIGKADVPGIVRDVADELSELGVSTSLEQRINHVLATMACHNSVRSGRKLRPEEMNALLREMEATPNSGQCNHGRPTFIELKLSEIEKLFGRR
ncbi:DNA mismatch repair endonuclease MutL [Aestuariivirga sp.]|uniref:DNA mismatch repair endonuclease MutL n=1 Tax=Aestuariivirga sp. TaxID=2650926 RepID=UPI003BAA8FE4